MLVICETHPVQYHAPVYQALSRLGLRFTVLYGSDFSVQGYRDKEFNSQFSWDTDLLSGYTSQFVQLSSDGGAKCYEEVTARGVAQQLCNLKPTAVLGLGYSVPFDRAVLHTTKRFSLPLMLRTEANDAAFTRSRLKSWFRDYALRTLYRRCSQLLYVGTHSKSHYLRLGVSQSKLQFSPYCVSTQAFRCDASARAELRPKVRQEFGLDEHTICVMFCGKLSQRKGVDILLEAVKRLPIAWRRRICLLMVGDGQLRTQLLHDSAQEPEVKLHITGFKNQSELSPFYHAADVSILPSIVSETWGLVVNESLHHGVPCLVSDRVGCVPDLVVPGQTGDIFSGNDVDDLCLKLTGFVERLADRRIPDLCRAKAAEYSVERAAEGISKAWAKMGLA